MSRDGNGLGPVCHSELLHDFVNVEIDRSFTYPQDNRYVPGTFPLFQPVEDFLFPERKFEVIGVQLLLVENVGKRQMEVRCNEFQYGRGTFVIRQRRA